MIFCFPLFSFLHVYPLNAQSRLLTLFLSSKPSKSSKLILHNPPITMPTEVATSTAWNFQIPVTASAEAMDEPCPELSSSVSTRDSALDTRSIHSIYTPPRKMTSKLQGLFHHSSGELPSGKRHSMNLFSKSRSSSQSSGSTSPSAIPSLSQKYGSCKKGFVSEGATAVIRLVTKSNCCSDVYCVKAFHKKAKDDSDRSYMKRMTSEFCISSTLRHENVVKTLDLVIDEKGRYCAVMEYVGVICLTLNLNYLVFHTQCINHYVAFL